MNNFAHTSNTSGTPSNGANKKLIIAVVAIVLALGALTTWLSTAGSWMQIAEMTGFGSSKNAGADGIFTQDIQYFENATGYLARPAQEGIYPGIVLIHENRGLLEQIKRSADDLAREGYIVFAVDLFGKTVETQEEARALTAQFDQAKGIENLKAATALVREQGAAKVASFGWCFGGAQSLALALSGEKLDATVIYYGRLEPSRAKLATIKWPVIGIFGDQDQVVPIESVKKFDTDLDRLGVENEIHIYPGVGHAFANPSNPNHAPEPTADAWAKVLAFLKKNLAVEPGTEFDPGESATSTLPVQG